MKPLVLLPTLLLLCGSASFAAELIHIDDTTLLDPDTGVTLFVERADAVAPALAPATRQGLRSTTDAYTGCSTSDNCAPFDRNTLVPGTTIDLLPEGNYPYDATMHPGGFEVWIPGASGDGVVVIDCATNVATQRVLVGEYPVSVAFSQDQGMALVACRDSEQLTIVSTNTYTVMDSLSVPTGYLGAGNIALDPIGGNFYVVDWFADDLYEVAADGSAVLRTATVGASLWQLVVSPDGETIYVTDRNTDQVRVIDRATLTQTNAWAVGDDPWGIDITLDGQKLVVACEDSHEAYVIETATGVTTALLLDATADPRDVDIRDDQGIAYVAGGAITGGNPVYRVDLTTDTVLGNVPVSGTNVNVITAQPQATLIFVDSAPFSAAGSASLSARPNPFGVGTSVRYSLTQAASVRLSVSDVAGRIVRRLESGTLGAGSHETPWDGRDDGGGVVANGVYFVRLEIAGGVTTRKVVRMNR